MHTNTQSNHESLDIDNLIHEAVNCGFIEAYELLRELANAIEYKEAAELRYKANKFVKENGKLYIAARDE